MYLKYNRYQDGTKIISNKNLLLRTLFIVWLLANWTSAEFFCTRFIILQVSEKYNLKSLFSLPIKLFDIDAYRKPI